MLVLIHLQQQRSPCRRDSKVHVGALGLAVQLAAVEGQVLVLLVFKGDACCLQRLVSAQLLGLGERLGLAAVLGAHVLQQRLGTAKTVAELWASFNRAWEVLTLGATIA